MIQPEITAQDDKIKARRKQYLQHLRVGGTAFLFVRVVKAGGCGQKGFFSVGLHYFCPHSSAWIVRGLLAEWDGGRLDLKCGETLEWCPFHGVHVHLVTHYLCVQEMWRLSSSFKP